MHAHRRKNKKHKPSSPAGPPGTLSAVPDAPKPILRAIAYGPGECIDEETTDLDSLHTYLERWPVTWLNIDGLGDTEVIRRLGEIFGLHPLTLEDVLHLHERPKVEEYGENLFLVLRMLEPGGVSQTEQVSMFLGDRFVLTFQEHPGDCFDELRRRIREGRGRVRNAGADYLAYCILDSVVDGYFPYLDVASDLVEDLETEVLEKPTPETVSKIHQLKRDLLSVRRVMSPTREAISVLLRDAPEQLSPTTLVYLRDAYDHAVQLLELVETYRELAGGLLDVYLSSVSNRMNEIMKVLTVIATIFIPLGFFAGLYGMNFDTEKSPWNMPELGWYWGYPAFLIFLVVVVLVQLLFFWRKGWLRKP